jgi:hypothetical protein
MSYYFDNKNILSGPTVKQQDSHMVMGGVIKPLKERIVSIDTKFRKDIFNFFADVTLMFDEKLTEVKSIEVDTIDIPMSFFNIRDATFDITKSSVLHTVTLTPGFYSNTAAVASEINTKLTDIGVGFAATDISFNINGGKGVFSTTSDTFDISFNGGKSGLGWLLGFRANSYTIQSSSKTATSEGVILLKYPRHIYVALNEFSNSNVNSFHIHSSLNKNIIARISVPDTGFGTTITATHSNGFLVSEVRRYLEKVNIQRINLQLLDENGNIIDLHGGDFSITLRLVCE